MDLDILKNYDSAEIGESDPETRSLLAELENELGVKGTAAVFRRALALAKSARAHAEREFGPLKD